jgi:hypothetical protein
VYTGVMSSPIRSSQRRHSYSRYSRTEGYYSKNIDATATAPTTACNTLPPTMGTCTMTQTISTTAKTKAGLHTQSLPPQKP